MPLFPYRRRKVILIDILGAVTIKKVNLSLYRLQRHMEGVEV
jgi:hypothetical protein